MMMDAIVGAWVNAIGGEGVIGALLGTLFVLVIAFVFFKIST
jgi:hypothetical protein